MTATDFKEVNLRIAEHQEEYQTLPVCIDLEEPEHKAIMCFKLDENEIKQVNETGEIWISVLTFGKPFQPIGMSLLKPEGFK